MKNRRTWLFALMLTAILWACTPPATPLPTMITPAVIPTRPATPTIKGEATPKPAATPSRTAAPTPAGIPYYQGKTIEVLAATAVGGGTDATARVVATFLPRYIPGNPRMLVRNQAGAGGVVAANSFFTRAKGDGLTLLHGSSSVIASQQRGRDVVRYDLLKMPFIGNIGESPAVTAIRKGALGKLRDPGGEALVVGTREGAEVWNVIPLYGKEFLGWNVRWVTGFGGTGEIVLAFRRGEVDIFGDGQNIKMVVDEGLAEPLAQIGKFKDGKFTRIPDYPDTPTLVEALGDKKPAGLAWDGYIAALAPPAVFKFTAAAPGTPDNVVKTLVDAYARMNQDPAFHDMLRKTFAQVYEVNVGKDTEQLVRAALEVSPEAAGYVDSLLRKFGVIK